MDDDGFVVLVGEIDLSDKELVLNLFELIDFFWGIFELIAGGVFVVVVVETDFANSDDFGVSDEG